MPGASWANAQPKDAKKMKKKDDASKVGIRNLASWPKKWPECRNPKYSLTFLFPQKGSLANDPNQGVIPK